MSKVIVFGSLNMDLTIECDRMPRMGETLTGRNFLLNAGGKGANQAVAAARLGADVHMLGAVGTDVFGDSLRASLEQAGVDCGRLQRIEGTPTGVASITRVAGDNCIVLDPGANHVLRPKDVKAALDELAYPGDIFLTQLECDIPSTFAALAEAHRRGLYTIFNPAPAVSVPRETWKSVNLVCLNETECEIVTGVFPDSDDAARRAMELLVSWGVSTVALTLGAQGSRVLSGDTWIVSLPPSVEVTDTTGAGDTYIGALAMARARGLSLEEAIAWATHASALACTRVGAQQAIPSTSDVMSSLGMSSLGTGVPEDKMSSPGTGLAGD